MNTPNKFIFNTATVVYSTLENHFLFSDFNGNIAGKCGQNKKIKRHSKEFSLKTSKNHLRSMKIILISIVKAEKAFDTYNIQYFSLNFNCRYWKAPMKIFRKQYHAACFIKSDFRQSVISKSKQSTVRFFSTVSYFKLAETYW